MADEPTPPHSGSRWEPPTTPTTPATPTDPADSPPPASTPAAQASAGPRQLRGRVAVVGAAVGLRGGPPDGDRPVPPGRTTDDGTTDDGNTDDGDTT